ncbi:hypothetical protein EDC04DRAFT_749239 [Pisolithus marmoratus]|nr:hypothetical protein EDC04DRAFT_749239 [Pisolithus marmoratus]
MSLCLRLVRILIVLFLSEAQGFPPGPAPPTSGLPSNFQQAQGPHTPAMPSPTMVASLGHSMTPNTHPPPYTFGVPTKVSTTAGALSASLLASQQPQPSPFLQPLTASHSQHMLGHGHGPHGPPTSSASSSALFRALSRSQAQAQAQAQAQTQTPSPSIPQPQGQAQGPAEPPIQSIQSIPSMQEQMPSIREAIPLSHTIQSIRSSVQESISSLPQATQSMQQMASAIQMMEPMQRVQFLPVHEGPSRTWVGWGSSGVQDPYHDCESEFGTDE